MTLPAGEPHPTRPPTPAECIAAATSHVREAEQLAAHLPRTPERAVVHAHIAAAQVQLGQLLIETEVHDAGRAARDLAMQKAMEGYISADDVRHGGGASESLTRTT